MLLGRIVETPDGYKDAKRLRIAFRDKVFNIIIQIGAYYNMYVQNLTCHAVLNK